MVATSLIFNADNWRQALTSSPSQTQVNNYFNNDFTATLYAEWNVISYKVKYYGNPSSAANVPAIQNCTYDVEYSIPANIPVRQGYTFLGWHTNTASLNPEFRPGDIFKNLHDRQDSVVALHAIWKPNNYLITFDKRGGSSGHSSVIATYDSIVPSASAPLRNGYVFVGYYDDPAAIGKRYYDGSMGSRRVWDIPQNNTLYAIWHTTTMDVPLEKMCETTMGISDCSGGSDYVPAAIYQNPMPAGLTAPQRTGYLFRGYWSLPIGGVQYYDENMLSAVPAWDAQYARLYAHWAPDTFMVSFVNNCAANPDTMALRAIYREPLELPSPPYYPACPGKEFMYWTNNPYDVQSPRWYETMLYNYASDTMLYADWRASQYKISFQTNYTGITKLPRYVVNGSAIGYLPELTPLVNDYGYHHAGWFYPDTLVSQGSRQYRESDLYDIPSDATFHAKWDRNQHTLHLHADGGTYTNGLDSMDKIVYYRLPVGYMDIPHRIGADFLGYYDVAQAEASGSERMWEITDTFRWDYDRAIYAHWYLRTDTIYFDARGGSVSPSKKPVKINTIIGTMPVPIKDGFTFLGWHTTIYDGSPLVSDTMRYRTDGNMTLYAHWLRNTYTITFSCPNRADTIVYRLYGERISPPYLNPILTARNGDTLLFDGWYPSGAHASRWDFALDTITGNTTLMARWMRVISIIDRAPAAAITYGEKLGEARISDGYWHCYDGNVIDCGGRFRFTNSSHYPIVADSAVTDYEIGFFPDDSLYYEPAFTTIKVSVKRRQLRVKARSSSLRLTTDGVLRAPGSWSDIPSYLVGRYDMENVAPQDGSFFAIYANVSLANTASYYESRGVGVYRREIIVSGASQTQNYNVDYVSGDLSVTRLSFLPPDSIIYGDPLYLNASSQYNEALQYSSSRPEILFVHRDFSGQWAAQTRHVGVAKVCVYAAGSAILSPDTLCTDIRVSPRRGVRITAPSLNRLYGTPLPRARQYSPDITGLHNSAERDTIFDAGLLINAIGVPSDTPPAGIYKLEPCCVSHPNYANFIYEDGTLTVIQCDGTMRQILTFDSLPAVNFSQQRLVVWARAETSTELSRMVRYESSNPQVAYIAKDTMYIMDENRCAQGWCDTLWGAIVQFRKTGTTEITAYSQCDAVHHAVHKVRELHIVKNPQTIALDAPQTLDVGESYTLRGSATSGLRVWFSIEDNGNAAEVTSDSILVGRNVGTAALAATQPGNEIYAMAQQQRSIAILAPNQGILFSMRLRHGTLSPSFSPRKFEYEYNMVCDYDTIYIAYDPRSAIDFNDDVTMIDDSTIVIAPFREYGGNGQEIVLKVTTHQGIVNEYTFALRPRLPKDFIYYSPEKFPNRMEVVNNPMVNKGRKFKDTYRWFQDDEPIPGMNSGVLYNPKDMHESSGKHGIRVGSVYSAMAYFDVGTVYNSDSVYICGQRAVLAAKGLTAYPNPAVNYVVVRHQSIGVVDEPIVIYNSMGGEMASYPPSSISIDASDHTATLDISALAGGGTAYIIKFLDASVVIVKQ